MNALDLPSISFNRNLWIPHVDNQGGLLLDAEGRDKDLHLDFASSSLSPMRFCFLHLAPPYVR